MLMVDASSGEPSTRRPSVLRRVMPNLGFRVPRRDRLNAAVAATLAAVVALWATGRDAAAWHPATVADAFISAGRLSGLLAADLMLVAVVLMARVPVIERVVGHDDLSRRHRLVAMWSFGLLWFHVGIVTIGYARRVSSNVVTMAWKLASAFPGMWLAVAALAATTLVASTSGRAARRRLRYESWHLLHLYAYLGAGLAVPHQIWVGEDFVASWAARVFWLTAWFAAAAVVLVFRVLVPLRRTVRHRLRVLTVTRESPDVVSVTIGGRHLEELRPHAGQYFIWRFRDGQGWTRGHPYSLSAAPSAKQLRFTVKDSGDGSGRPARLRPGTKVMFEGPYGAVTRRRWGGGKVAMIAGGIGIAPLLALLEDLPYADGDAVLIYRARDDDDVVFRDELVYLDVVRGLEIHYLLGPRATGSMSWLPQDTALGCVGSAPLLDLVPDLAQRDVFVCGPEPWADLVVAAASAAGVPADRLHRERFDW